MIMGIVAILVAAAGFGGSLLYGTVTGAKTLTPLVRLHAAVFSSWLVLYLVQTGIVATGRTEVHRRLGIASVVLGVATVGIGYQTAVTAARRGYDLTLDVNIDPLRFLAFSLGDLLSFTILVAAGVWYRRQPEVHKRLMLLATVGPLMAGPLVRICLLLPVPQARLPLFLAALAAMFFAGAVYDRIARGQFHPVSLWGAAALFAWGNLRATVIGPSDTWHQFAAWLIR